VRWEQRVERTPEARDLDFMAVATLMKQGADAPF
jgi:hypothetical protein